MREGFVPSDPRFTSLVASVARLEYGLIVGGILLLVGLGLGIYAYAVRSWGDVGFGALDPERTMRLVFPLSLDGRHYPGFSDRLRGLLY